MTQVQNEGQARSLQTNGTEDGLWERTGLVEARACQGVGEQQSKAGVLCVGGGHLPEPPVMASPCMRKLRALQEEGKG